MTSMTTELEESPAPGGDAQANGLLAATPDQRVMLHMPVDVRSVSLGLLAVIACVFVLHWASEVFIPLMLGVVFSYALSPMVDWLERKRIPRMLSAAVLLLGLIGGIGTTAYALSDDASTLIDSLPDAAQKLRRLLQPPKGSSESALAKVEKAAAQLERAAAERAATVPTTSRGVTRVQIERPRFDIHDYLWTGTLGLMTGIGQAVLVCFITYFLIISGTTFRRKLVKIAGPTFSQKKITVQVLDEINDQIQRYLLVQVVTSTFVGVATFLAFLVTGVDHAAVWGLAAFALNFVPYVGAVAVTGATALVGLMQFGSVDMALLVGAVSACINAIEGYLMTPWLTSRASRMNPVMVFVGVLAWGWLWGMWGLFLGVPILMIIKSVCDRVEDLRPIGELMGV